ncbi:MAG TPA: hypothetical protein VHS28_05775, partial [Chloroflexota bacterium]|nr:hypothetical protein [Chloroflexota bacterium]
ALSILRRTAQLNPGNGVARAVFVAASLPFPRVESDAEIPDEELIDAGLSQVPVLSVGNGDDRSEQSVQGLQETELAVSEEDASQDYRPVQPMETAAESECVRQRDRVPEYWASSPLVDMWRRLRRDPLSAPEVADELLSMAESDLADAALLWLAADALALSGRFRRATALYRRIAQRSWQLSS